MSSLRSRFKGPDAEERFIAQRDKARTRALEAIRRKRSDDPAARRLREVYAELVAEYGERCAICGDPPGPTRRLAIDHDHATDEIRGLLCHKCNLILGHAKDSVVILQSAIDFLSRDAHTGRSFAEVTSMAGKVE